MLDWKKNMEQLFGKYSLWWLLPVAPHDRTTDGVNYPYPEQTLATELITPFNLRDIL